MIIDFGILIAALAAVAFLWSRVAAGEVRPLPDNAVVELTPMPHLGLISGLLLTATGMLYWMFW